MSKSPYTEGYEAGFTSGYGVVSRNPRTNPYSQGSKEHALWEQGNEEGEVDGHNEKMERFT